MRNEFKALEGFKGTATEIKNELERLVNEYLPNVITYKNNRLNTKRFVELTPTKAVVVFLNNNTKEFNELLTIKVSRLAVDSETYYAGRTTKANSYSTRKIYMVTGISFK